MPQQKPQHLPTAEANFECCIFVHITDIWGKCKDL